VGIVHAAAVFDDASVATLDDRTLETTWLPKAYGAWRLHEVTAGLDLDWWLGFSSCTALHGMPGQPAYASANAYLDALAASRRARGLPATTVSWGAWADVGAAAGLDVPWLDRIGPGESLELLAEVLAADASGVGALRLNTDRLVADFPSLRRVPFFTALVGTPSATTGSTDWPGVAVVRELPPDEGRRLVAGQLRYRIASVIGLSVADLSDDRPLVGLGLDSLLAVRVRNAVRHDFELNLPMSTLLRGGSLADLCDELCAELGILAQEPAPAPAPDALVPPRDAAERLLAATWQEVLGVPVGITHDFAALGGDDSRAERITALVAARTGRDLTVSTLFARPTIELMADVVRAADRHTGSVRVLRESGPRPPLFFFHPGGGDTAVYRQLVDLLDPPVAAYGFDRIGETVTVEQRIARYLPELRRLQSTGPYRLVGWSFGGFLAFEMAQQLTVVGEHVELLALMDSIVPPPQQPDLSEVDRLVLQFQRIGEFLETSYGRHVELPLAEMARLDDDEAQADLLVAAVVAAGVVDPQVSEAILAHQRGSFLDSRMLERYRPAPYHGRTVFYSAADQVPGGLRDPRFDRTDPARGWDAVCSDIDVVTVPGHHLSLLDPPNVRVLARRLADLLRE
jgi:phthiocerol/phenolphthiocerol synthesis type-I polyketide synthase D